MQADQIHLIALQVQRKYYSEPNKDSQRWISRHDQLHSDRSLPKQELPATMLSMDYTRVWYSDKCAILLASLLQLPCINALQVLSHVCRNIAVYTVLGAVGCPDQPAMQSLLSTVRGLHAVLKFSSIRCVHCRSKQHDVMKCIKLSNLMTCIVCLTNSATCIGATLSSAYPSGSRWPPQATSPWDMCHPLALTLLQTLCW